jgi:hypothetical protein
MYADGLGLYLKVRLGNSKAGTSDIASPANCGDMGLGPLHTVSLAQAREQAEVCRVMRLKGLDPLEERLKEQQAKRLGPNHLREVRRDLHRHPQGRLEER